MNKPSLPPINTVSTHEIQELQRLVASDGWLILKRLLSEDLQQACLALAQPGRPAQDIEFRRGAIFAASKLPDLPDQLIEQLRQTEYLRLASQPDISTKKQET